MLKTIRHIAFAFCCFTTFLQCNSKGSEAPNIHYEIVNSGMVSDSLSAHLPSYPDDLKHWKSVYADCLHDSVFPDAFYLGLQTNLGIGGISNQYVRNINKQITVLDTSAKGNLFDILAIYKSGNCFSKINLNKSLQDEFYRELISKLSASADYAYLADLIDSNQISFNIPTMTDISIRPDTLVSILGRTKDSSLLEFKRILTTPGNALLVRAGIIFGFDSELRLKRNLTPAEQEKFKNEVSFTSGINGGRGSIKSLPNQNLRINIVRYYTVFGQFYVFK
jgi:hypothetical protein